MSDKNTIDEIVNMLDSFVNNGGGHMNIEVKDPEDIGKVKVDVYKSMDCSKKDMACAVPTLQKNMDETSEA